MKWLYSEGEERPARRGPAHGQNLADLDWIVEKLSSGAGCSEEPLGLAAPPRPLAHPHTHLLYTHTPHQNMGDRDITHGHIHLGVLGDLNKFSCGRTAFRAYRRRTGMTHQNAK